jgi:hypothetical protein
VETRYHGYATHGLPGVEAALAAGVDHLMDDPFVIRAPDECLEKLARFRWPDVTHVALRLFWPGMTQAEGLGMIELVAARLLPTLQKLRARWSYRVPGAGSTCLPGSGSSLGTNVNHWPPIDASPMTPPIGLEKTVTPSTNRTAPT